MKNGKSVAIALAIIAPVLLLGGGLALAADDAPESEPGVCLSACSDAYQTGCATECEQRATSSTELECVGIGCWDPRLEPVVGTQNDDSQDAAADASDADSLTSTEPGCAPCDVVLLNEYPEYRYR